VRCVIYSIQNNFAIFQPALITTLNWLAFSCNGSAENPVNVVELVANGCISNNTTAANLSLKITRSGVGQTVCLSFLMPRMKACDEEFFIHANIQLCEQNRRLVSSSLSVIHIYYVHKRLLERYSYLFLRPQTTARKPKPFWHDI